MHGTSEVQDSSTFAEYLAVVHRRRWLFLLVLVLVPMMALNDLGRPAFIGYYLGVMTLWVVFACANARAARVPAPE